MAGQLVVHRDENGIEHRLEGRPLRKGQGLELLLPDGRWLIGAYNWSFRVGEAPRLEIVLGGEWEERRHDPKAQPTSRPTAQLLLPGEAVLRWPGEG